MRSLTIAAIGLTVDFSNHPPGIGPRSTQVLRSGRAGRWAVRLTVSRAAGPPFRRILVASLLLMAIAVPELALAQASPFMTGASALQTNLSAWLTPVAIILVMVLGAMAMANRLSWGWCIAAILGIAISFGATQIVTWVREI